MIIWQIKHYRRLKKILIEKSDDTKILIDTDNKLSDGITLKRIVILVTCVIKHGIKFYTQLFLEHALSNE